MQWDLIIRNAKVFDGTGMPGALATLLSVREKSRHVVDAYPAKQLLKKSTRRING